MTLPPLQPTAEQPMSLYETAAVRANRATPAPVLHALRSGEIFAECGRRVWTHYKTKFDPTHPHACIECCEVVRDNASADSDSDDNAQAGERDA